MRGHRGITNNYDTSALVTDARDLLSFHPVDVVFTPYDASQLRDIPEYRVEQAFYPSALSDEVIPLCAALAAQRNGDARYALDFWISLPQRVFRVFRRYKKKLFEALQRLTISPAMLSQQTELLSKQQMLRVWYNELWFWNEGNQKRG